MPTQSSCRCYELLNRTLRETKSMELLTLEPRQSAWIVRQELKVRAVAHQTSQVNSLNVKSLTMATGQVAS